MALETLRLLLPLKDPKAREEVPKLGTAAGTVVEE